MLDHWIFPYSLLLIQNWNSTTYFLHRYIRAELSNPSESSRNYSTVFRHLQILDLNFLPPGNTNCWKLKMLASSAMEMQSEETPLALQRLWNLTRARLAGTSTALDEELALVDSLPAARVRTFRLQYFIL